MRCAVRGVRLYNFYNFYNFCNFYNCYNITTLGNSTYDKLQLYNLDSASPLSYVYISGIGGTQVFSKAIRHIGNMRSGDNYSSVVHHCLLVLFYKRKGRWGISENHWIQFHMASIY